MELSKGYQIYKNMGGRYFFYRVYFELEKRTGILKKKHPVNPKSKDFISLNDWKELPGFFIYPNRNSLNLEKKPTQVLKDKANKILNHSVQFFSDEWINLGPDYDWITNPETNYKYDISKHWSDTNDFDKEAGDIKYVWEKSRFGYLLTLLRFDYHFDEDHSEFVFNEIESWINSNPVNMGPNWKCSQEISLRIFNWMYCLYFYQNSPFLTEELWFKIQNSIYHQIIHVYQHINFSRIAVRSNHTITETLLLTLTDILFPFFPESKLWCVKGRKYFEEEILYQIYDDGAFIQHSMNYHRVLIQLLSFGICITQNADKPFSKSVYERSSLALNFLMQFVQEKNGHLPNYGANDGALFFPLSDNEFRDYRPQLNTLFKILYAKDLFEGFEEDLFSFKDIKRRYDLKELTRNQVTTVFEKGGYYIFRKKGLFVFIKCSSYKDRPSQADNLHIDIWKEGKNVFRDGGSYKYNAKQKWVDFFFGTQSHNTVTIENYNQMLKGGRFIWYHWTSVVKISVKEDEEFYYFKGVIKAFTFLKEDIKHQREVLISKKAESIIVKDTILNGNGMISYQNWNISPDCEVVFDVKSESGDVKPKLFDSFYSSFYGKKELQKGLSFPFKKAIETNINFK